jgi:tRNA-binding EMAP/Myf-like protein
MSYVGRKSGRAALIHADIPSNLNLLGDYVKIPSATTTERNALTPAVGMLLYNTTLGIMQQYASSGWASIDSPPTVSSLNYPGDDTALDTVGEFNLSCTTQSSTTVLVPGSTMPSAGQVVKGTGISAPVINLTCGLTNTDATVTVAGSTTGLVVGMTVAEFTGVPSGATILSIITDTSFELSANATATNASAVLSFNTTVVSVSGTTSFVITPTATASATVTLTFNTQTLVITGTNFSVGATVTIDGTAPSTVSRDSSTQITVTGTPAKTAGTKADGLVVSNTSGLGASINVDYSALPDWQTASGNVGSLMIVGSEISTINLDATTATSYALTTGPLPPGLAMSPSTGDITGTITGSVYQTYNITVTATDAEAQSSPRLFNIITSAAPTGGTITTYSGYRVHSWTTVGTNQDGGAFINPAALDVEILIVGGGGSAGGRFHAGGGGAGGVRQLTISDFAAATHSITVGAGGPASAADNVDGSKGSNSGIDSTTTGGTYVATGGGYGAGYDGDPGDGGSGGGGNGGDSANPNEYGLGNEGSYTPVEGYAGDAVAGTGYTAGGGGGGAGGLGGGTNAVADGGTGIANYWRSGSSGTTIGTHLFGGGGVGSTGYNSTGHTANSGVPVATHGGGAMDAAGVANSGGGGGASAATGGGGSTGGSGIVIIRYAT